MTDYQIPASVVEAAARELNQREMLYEPKILAREALRAAFDELGMREVLGPVKQYCLVSRWMPVE